MKTVLGILMMLLASGCVRNAYTRSSWTAGPDVMIHDNILVVALAGKHKSYVQKMLEQDMVAQIRARGYNATSYFERYGATDDDRSGEASVTERLKNNRESAILTIVLVDTTMRESFIPADATYESLDQVNTRAITYFSSENPLRYNSRYAAGAYDADKRYYWQTSLYMALSHELAYTTITETKDYGSTDRLAGDYANQTIKDMRHNELLQKPDARKRRELQRIAIAVK